MAPARTPGPSAEHNALELQGRGCSKLSPLPLLDEFVGGFDGKVLGSEGGNLFQLVQLLRIRSGIVCAFDVEDTEPAPRSPTDFPTILDRNAANRTVAAGQDTFFPEIRSISNIRIGNLEIRRPEEAGEVDFL